MNDVLSRRIGESESRRLSSRSVEETILGSPTLRLPDSSTHRLVEAQYHRMVLNPSAKRASTALLVERPLVEVPEASEISTAPPIVAYAGTDEFGDDVVVNRQREGNLSKAFLDGI